MINATFPRRKLAELVATIAKFNKKGADLKIEILSEDIKKEVDVIIDGVEGKLMVNFVEVAISGETKYIDGWKLAGSISKTETGANIVNGYEDNLEDYRNHAKNCEHCNTNRYRKLYLVLENEEGERKAVGTSCVKDYLGNETAKSILDKAKYFEKVIKTIEEDYCSTEYGTGLRMNIADLESVFHLTKSVVETNGFVSKKNEAVEENRIATSNIVESNIFSGKWEHEKDGDFEGFKKYVAGTDNSSYWNNIKTLVADIDIDIKYFGYFVSAVASWIRSEAESKEMETAEEVLEGRNEYTGTIVSFKEYSSQYGTTWKMLVKEERGFKLFGTVASSISDAKIGDKVKFVATVEKKDDGFGIYKRPSKAEVLAA